MSDNERSLTLTPGAGDWRQRLIHRQLARIERGRLSLRLPDGQQIRIEGAQDGPEAGLSLLDAGVLRRVLGGGDIGFAEGYMAGEWDSPDLAELMYLLHLNQDRLVPRVPGLQGLAAMRDWIGHVRRRNSRRGSRRNIAYHYDLGNDFYGLWLDPTWTYSSAVFARPDQALEDAQRHKYRLLLERLDLRPEHHLLEIGCGWGGFALYAAETVGCRVTGITLSREQLDLARERARAAGLDDRVAFRLQDYRDIDAVYDRVASIEMYEAVGEAYWPGYFAAVRGALAPNGRAAIQGITIDEASFPAYRRRVDFIQKYIFPGGMLASPTAFREHARAAGLRPVDTAFYGADYARTLRLWDERVREAAAAIRRRFDERFLRMWRYYLAYCEAGFRSGNIDLMHITLERD
ncbi:cyclopropane-fatty-acyl-phospholipid synthase [Salinisphaera sp. PC39]|uniref:cyclopropane-fatty-acyl-phospholipid synthase family protein n=1 Tax=Salinisphaera sp. PC39 TaxID=1304156 RepID=UPI003341E511